VEKLETLLNAVDDAVVDDAGVEEPEDKAAGAGARTSPAKVAGL
jgi:hypothetical protein